MVRQYIGARYVPKFYENSDGTHEWRSGVAYEPLTIVSYNGNSYTSKKPVPSNIGDPSANGEYWAVTGLYNEQVEALREAVEELKDEYDDLDRKVICLSQNPTRNPTGTSTALKVANHAFLIDLGLFLNFAENVATLKKYGIDTIDGILITHYHGDHDGNPYSDGDYSAWADEFDMSSCVFYLPLDPPAGVSAWESTSKTKLMAAYPDNQFLFPPYGNIDFRGITIEAFNNLQSDYDYYIANNVTDYNQYSQMVRAEYLGSSILVMGDAGEPAQNYQYSLGKFKHTTVYCLPHHGLDGAASIGMLNRIAPKYMFVSNGYNSNNFMRDYALAYADRNNVPVMEGVLNYPDAVVGDFSAGEFLSGSCRAHTTYAGYGHKTIYVNPATPATVYQDGTQSHPYSSMRRAICACTGGFNTIMVEGDMTNDNAGAVQITRDNGHVEIMGQGHSAAGLSILVAHGASFLLNSFFNPDVVTLDECSVGRIVACGTIGQLQVRESMLVGSSFTITTGGYRSSFVAIGPTVYTGTGNFT